MPRTKYDTLANVPTFRNSAMFFNPADNQLTFRFRYGFRFASCVSTDAHGSLF
jgi:hypothetical protein